MGVVRYTTTIPLDMTAYEEHIRQGLRIKDEARFVLNAIAEGAPHASAKELNALLDSAIRTARALARIACEPWDGRHSMAWAGARAHLVLARLTQEAWDRAYNEASVGGSSLTLPADDRLTLDLDIP